MLEWLKGLEPLTLICLTIGFVLLLNVGLALSLTRSGIAGEFHQLRRAFRAARNPFRQEGEDLEKLHQLVSDLKEKDE